MMTIHRYFIAATAAVCLSACEAGPDYARPDADVPTAFKEVGDWSAAEPQDSIDRGAWWNVYRDPVLNDLENKITISNQNLKAAEAAYRASLAAVAQTEATLFPSVAAAPSVKQTGAAGQKPVTTYAASVNATWDVDVWGRIRRSIESGEANAEASAADLASARLSAEANLAADYFNLRLQDELQRVLDQNVANDKKILQIVQNQYAAGIAARSDVLSAQTQMESTESLAINTGIKRAQYEHAIAVLIGQAPSVFSLKADTKYAGRVPNIPAEVPSEIVQRRPDVASAERAVAAANAGIGVATSAWFPSLTLSGAYGYSSITLGKLLQASSNLWSFGPTLAETIFDAGARAAAVEEARATFDESVANYRQTVLTAFQQVEDNLASMRILAEQAKMENAALADARHAETLTLNQYKAGIVPYNTVLTAQIATLNNQQNAMTVNYSRITASVALIEALGGGWDGNLSPR